MSEAVAVQPRKTGILLIIGIIFFPIIFVWFLLRQGHSTLSRVLGFGWLILCIIGFSATPTSAPKSTGQAAAPAAVQSAPAPAATPAPPKEVPVVSSVKVAQDYDENTVAADMAYKDQTIKVTGTIQDISTDLFGDPYLALNGTNQFQRPQAKFDKDDLQSLAKLKKGQKVALVCVGAGDVAKTPMFKKCSLAN